MREIGVAGCVDLWVEQAGTVLNRCVLAILGV